MHYKSAIGLVIGAALMTGSAFAADNLFLSAAPASTDIRPLAKSDSAQLVRMKSDAKIAALVEGLHVNPAAAQTKDLHLNLMPDVNADAHQQKTYETADGGHVWIGNITSSAKQKAHAGDNAILVTRNGLTTGSVRINNELYSIRPLSNGEHVVAKMDQKRYPPDHPPEAYAAIFEESLRHQQDLHLDSNSHTVTPMAGSNYTMRILVNYTPAVAAAVTDINSMIDLAIAETNTGYANSGINITAELAGKGQVSYTEASSIDIDKDRYASKTDGYMDSIHAQRDSVAADIGVLLVNNGQYCGIAKAIGATESTAFAAVYYDCATGYYSFAHEMGHLQSARHDPANDPTTTPYAYGHGFQAPNKAWRTVMAYDCTAGCPRINYWSNPLKTYSDGQKMGTTASNDNVRVLNATAATVTSFRGTVVPPGPSYTNTGDYAIPDNNSIGISSPVSVTTTGASGTLSVSVNIVHTYSGDLVLDLLAPDGTVYNLQSRVGGSTANINKTFSVNAGTKSRNGTWKLRVKDLASVDTGYINDWTLTFPN